MVKNKIKPILPCLKEKKRYLVFEILAKDNFKNQNKICFEIKNQLKFFFGVFNYSKAGIVFLKNQFNNKKGIIRVDNKYLDLVKASFCLITKIDETKVIIKTNKVFGSIKKAQIYLN
jgi:RNase P/RNase MRP subunit POP5